MSLVIEKAGPLSLVQDQGRYGYQAMGVTSGGPMDVGAFQWANRLLDNPPNAPQVEITMGPFRGQFLQATSFALCGADGRARLNGQPVAPWSSMRAAAGDRLEISPFREGLRCYLAVSGGFSVVSMLGSTSCVVRDKLGGLIGDGEPLRDGDELAFEPQLRRFCRSVPTDYIPEYTDFVKLGVLPGYQFEAFTSEAREAFFETSYSVTQQMDRMGIRLAGQAVKTPGQTFISEGIALGAIQIPADGQPIILMRDRQTIGGYPKMGCVCQQDLDKLAQARPGTRVQFYFKDIYKASNHLRQQQYFFLDYKTNQNLG